MTTRTFALIWALSLTACADLPLDELDSGEQALVVLPRQPWRASSVLHGDDYTGLLAASPSGLTVGFSSGSFNDGHLRIFRKTSSVWRSELTYTARAADGTSRGVLASALDDRRAVVVTGLALDAIDPALHTFERDDATGEWIERQVQYPEEWRDEPTELALDGDLLVASSTGDLHPDRVWTYDWSESGWAFSGTLNESGANGTFGAALAMSAAELVIGSPGASGGHVYTYGRSKNRWVLRSTLQGERAPGVISTSFGKYLALAGERLVVSAPGEGANGSGVGTGIYVFAKAASGWWQRHRLEVPGTGPVATNQGTFVVQGWEETFVYEHGIDLAPRLEAELFESTEVKGVAVGGTSLFTLVNIQTSFLDWSGEVRTYVPNILPAPIPPF